MRRLVPSRRIPLSCLVGARSFSAAKWSTPLAKQLHEAISATGPVPLASYMRMCLTGDLGGYYSGALAPGRDQFGPKGDFVTSPEICQVFGELVGLWFVAEWMSQGRPSKGIELIELGPGRGTLMDDILRTIQLFPDMANALDSVLLVEASEQLRKTQKALLCGPDALVQETKLGMQGVGRRLGKPIVWTDSIKSIPIEPDKTPFIVAHEFFDALPIHSFQSVLTQNSQPSRPVSCDPASEWREFMVATNLLNTAASSSSTNVPPEFQLMLSKSTTRHSRYLPETSLRYRRLKQIPDATIEICPDASLFAAEIATRIGGSSLHPKPSPSGAALVIDYGTSDSVPVNSLRGIRSHRSVHPLSSPGLVDLSADVDFTSIAENSTLASDGVEVHGPVLQADFLELMGIRERAAMLTKKLDKSKAQDFEKAWKRLVDRGPNGMGKVYKALAIIPENQGRRRPVGFGGDVT
ncbi:hypothetical protein CDD81_824 [Ophiocordyceps australis]|uniref:Protein arginine methyltransferase NDUFAF7 n=1 Tax=Ophiocordyceps australis TaxID=1399860 RepID=A0A2C5Y058_9HYPO|nr:hypothetical protein CDD81_824 [Ophiocordyceps australis]